MTLYCQALSLLGME